MAKEGCVAQDTQQAVTRPKTDAPPENACPITPVVEVLFSRWTAPILWMLHTFGRQRFSELESRIAVITPKVLTQRLRQLERDGLITRTYHAEVPPRVEYEISALGLSLGSLFMHLNEWGTAHLREVEDARGRYDAALPGNR
ncbi:winged helix-turn-helix transcriptional regulator [Streptomyces sp. YKOK-I1]